MFQNKKKKYKIRPDYRQKNLKNPFFRQREQGRPRLLKWLILFFLVAIMTLIWFFFASSVWKINEINISGLTRIDETEIKNIISNSFEDDVLLFFSQRNIFLFPKAEALDNINQSYNFSQVEIKKKLPDTLQVIVSERPYAFIFQQGSDRFYADRDAYVIKEEAVKDEDIEKYFILENKSQAVYIDSNNKIILKEEYLNFVFALHEAIKNYEEFKVERYIIDQELNSLTVKFLAGPRVYFNVKNDAAEQVADLDLVKKEKIGDNFNSTQYIDMRFGKMIYIY